MSPNPLEIQKSLKTTFAAAILIAAAAFGKLPAILLLNIGGIPGALVGGVTHPPKGIRRVIAIFLCILGQSYVYLAYVAMIVEWTKGNTAESNFSAWVLWPLAFLAVVFPAQGSLFEAKKEADEAGHTNVQVQAGYFTLLLSIVGFAVFIAFPSVARMAWFWVPYVG